MVGWWDGGMVGWLDELMIQGKPVNIIDKWIWINGRGIDWLDNVLIDWLDNGLIVWLMGVLVIRLFG